MDGLILVKPTEAHEAEIRAYRQEFLDYGDELHGASGLIKYDDIPAWIVFVRAQESRATAHKLDYVDADQYLLICEGNPRILGMINFRHYLQDGHLAEHGGHIGFSIRPTERRKGYAKSMLMHCLKKCHENGLDKVLLTCDINNEASRKTILACGGRFERMAITGDETDERYWIALDSMAQD